MFNVDNIYVKFHNINFLDIHTIKNKSHEIWTETPCVLLNVDSELVKKYNLGS
jgi:hypothetical protein